MVDDHYQSIHFPFQELMTPENLSIKEGWNIDQLKGYFQTWSSVQNYKLAHPGATPVETLIEKILPLWGGKYRQVTFPVFIKSGK